MPSWGWILLIAGLSLIAYAILYVALHLPHRTMPGRQVPQGDPERDISVPIPMDVARADDLMESGHAMTAREIEEERRREARPRARTQVATYELALPGARSRSPLGVVNDVPPAKVGEVIYYQGGLWRVDAIEPTQSPEIDGRLIVSQTTDAPSPAAA